MPLELHVGKRERLNVLTSDIVAVSEQPAGNMTLYTVVHLRGGHSFRVLESFETVNEAWRQAPSGSRLR